MLALICKNKYPLSLTNFRPITLLNTDTKLNAYVLAQRFMKLLPLIISNDQNDYIKNRVLTLYKFKSLLIILNTLSLKVQFLFLDFRKAFDSIE